MLEFKPITQFKPVANDEMIRSLLDELRLAEERIQVLERKLANYRAYIDTAAGCSSCPR